MILLSNPHFKVWVKKRNYKIFTKIQSFSVIESTYIAQCQLKSHNITESHDSKGHGGSSGCPCTVYETGAPLFCDDLPVGTVGLRSACHFFNLTRRKNITSGQEGFRLQSSAPWCKLIQNHNTHIIIARRAVTLQLKRNNSKAMWKCYVRFSMESSLNKRRSVKK